MLLIKFSKKFVKELTKIFSKSKAIAKIKQLEKTKEDSGKFVALANGIEIRELKDKSFRFYFIQKNGKYEFITEEEFSKKIIQFVALSKKNNQQKVIDKLKEDLQKFGFKL